MHKDKNTNQYRVWLRPETIQNVKLLSLILNREDWNVVMDDLIRIGIYYMNNTAKMDLADWSDFRKLLSEPSELRLRIIKGSLPVPGKDDYDF